MRKAAFFVEGQTEQIFVRKLIEEIAGNNGISFREERVHGKGYMVLTEDIQPDPSHFAVIVDCQGDHSVKSAIVESRDKLKSRGFERVIGLHDLYPKALADLPKVLAGAAYGLRTRNPHTRIVIAVEEVEAWFVQETDHYAQIDVSLDAERILAVCGIDLSVDSAERIVHPAAVLHNIYQLAGKAYTKRRSNAVRTITSLNFPNLYFNCRALLPSFDQFAGEVEAFLSPPA